MPHGRHDHDVPPVAKRPEHAHHGRVHERHRVEIEDDLNVTIVELPQPLSHLRDGRDIELAVDDQPDTAVALGPAAHLEPSGHPCPLRPVYSVRASVKRPPPPATTKL